jgi:ParB family chromosome partitioning protein
VLEPLLVRKVAEGRYQVIAGERRYRAAGLAGRDMVPCLILEVDEAEARAISLVENVRREDLDIKDEARFFKELHDAGLSLRAIAGVIHKSNN